MMLHMKGPKGFFGILLHENKVYLFRSFLSFLPNNMIYLPSNVMFYLDKA